MTAFRTKINLSSRFSIGDKVSPIINKDDYIVVEIKLTGKNDPYPLTFIYTCEDKEGVTVYFREIELSKNNT